MKKKFRLSLWYFTIVLVFCLIAAVPRSIEMISGNFVFGFDQGKHWLGAKAIVVDHKFPLIGDEVGGARGFFQGPGWFYLLSVPFVIFHGDPYGAIVLMFFVGVSVIAASYLLFAPQLGLLSGAGITLLLAISPTLISSSRFAWPPFVIPILTVLYLFCVYKVIQGKKQYIPWVAGAIGVMANFEIAVAGTMLVTTGVLFLIYACKNKVSFGTMLLAGIVFLIPLSPLIIFDLRHDFLNIKGVWQTFFTNDRGPAVAVSGAKLLMNHYLVFKSEILGAFQLGYVRVVGFLIIWLAGFLIFFDKNYDKAKKTFLGFLYAFPLLLFIIFIGYRNDLWPWWLLELQVFGCFSFGIVLAYFLKKRHVIWKISVTIVILLMVTNFIQTSVRFWKYDYPDYGGVAKIKGKVDALDFIFKDAKTNDFGLFFFTPPIYTYAYDFVAWWKGTTLYGYVPPQEKKSVFYLLAEPDPEKPWTYKGWMETAIVGGRIVNTWTLPSGFIVQKRIME